MMGLQKEIGRLQRLHHWLNISMEKLLLYFSDISVLLEFSCILMDIHSLKFPMQLVVRLGVFFSKTLACVGIKYNWYIF